MHVKMVTICGTPCVGNSTTTFSLRSVACLPSCRVTVLRSYFACAMDTCYSQHRVDNTPTPTDTVCGTGYPVPYFDRGRSSRVSDRNLSRADCGAACLSRGPGDTARRPRRSTSCRFIWALHKTREPVKLAQE